MAFNDQFPITGVCVVSQNCPSGYFIINRCEDNPKCEADLWKDHMFTVKKTTRFLCMTRIFPLAGGRINNVLTDICVQEEKDIAPNGYSKLDLTQDTEEKAVNKKQMCVKMVPRTQAIEAINDIQFYCKLPRGLPPVGYTLAGEVNGLAIVFRTGPVPKENSGNILPSISPAPSYSLYESDERQRMSNGETADRIVRQPFVKTYPLSGVTFELHSSLKRDQSQSNSDIDIGVRIKERQEVMNTYDYPFTTERQALNTCENYGMIH